jgi:3-oxoacyl-[acyl-carrier protein] reductase
MNIEFRNKRILVVGAARGIGHAIARAFAQRDGQVLAADVLVEEMSDLVTEYPGSGRVDLCEMDVTDPDSIRAAVDDTCFDILVYVAGGVRGQRPLPIEQVTPAAFREIIEANLTGCFLLAQAVAPAMKRAGRGRIVTISSRAGLATSLTGIQAYASAKHAQIGLVKQLSQELGRFGITVNSVAPGFMATSPDYVRQWESYSESFRQTFAEQRIAMRRMGTPDDIAYAVLFLASDYASWITGQVLPVLGSPVA